MKFEQSYFQDELKDGFYVPAMMKRCHAAELEILEQISAWLNKNKIHWCADKDTLCGAICHQEFLPWSDRLQIMISEKDRNIFLAAVESLPKGLSYTGSEIVNGKEMNRSEDFLERYHGFPFACGISICFDNDMTVQQSKIQTFENEEIPLPDNYEKKLDQEFGSERCYRKTLVEDGPYPFYMEQEMRYRSRTNMVSPYFYEFRKGDLINNRDNDGATLAENFLNSFMDAHSQVLMAVQISDNDKTIRVFTKAQDTAVKFGNFIEINFPEASIVVIPMLEAYCNRLYLLGEVLTATPADLNTTRAEYGEKPVTPEVYLESCMKFASAVEAAVKNEIISKKEIVFLPFKVSGWKNMEPLYRYYKSRRDCRVYVVPVPYYYVTNKNTVGERVNEAAYFSDDLDAIPYDTFNLYTHMPDTVITQNPYDQYSMGLRLPADLYSDELRKFTKHLIYVPWFDEVDLEKMPARAMSDYYIRQPGVVKADVVLVRSPKMRKYYIDSLTDFAGEDTRPIWEEKIQTMQGSVVL